MTWCQFLIKPMSSFTISACVSVCFFQSFILNLGFKWIYMLHERNEKLNVYCLTLTNIWWKWKKKRKREKLLLADYLPWSDNGKSYIYLGKKILRKNLFSVYSLFLGLSLCVFFSLALGSRKKTHTHTSQTEKFSL